MSYDEMIKAAKEIGVKRIDLGVNDYLYFFYANNKGRGDCNVTIIRSTSPIRANCVKNQTEVRYSKMTSGWHGHVNFSKHVQGCLDL